MNNKYKIKQIIACLSIMFFTSSCEDFLSTPPSDLLTSDGFYQTIGQSEQGVIGIYSKLRYLSDYEYLNMSECRSDNAWVLPQTDALREYSEIGTFRAGNDITTFNGVWNLLYEVIYNANVAITKIPTCDFGSRTSFQNQLMGEAYFLRGWAYFELVRLFGNIPIIDQPMSPDEVQGISQSPAKDVYDKIIVPDMTKAKEMLPYSSDLKDANNASISGSGRADKIAAQSMLGRIYMTMAGFPVNDATAKALAETELKSVIDYANSNNKYWAPDSTEWRKQWLPANSYYNKYSIFAIQYRPGGTGNPAVFNYSPALPPTYTNIRIFGNSIFVEKSLMYEFDKVYTNGETPHKDARGYGYSILTGYDAEPNFPAYTQETEKVTADDGSQVDVYVRSMIYKYTPTFRKCEALGETTNFESDMKDYYDWPVNCAVIRLEDIQLMYAEILVEKGDISGAMSYVNKIRERAGCNAEAASNSAEAMKFVKRERRIELLGEGVRWFDLVRWGEWKTAIENMFDRYNNPEGTDKANLQEGRYLYPIPLEQMNVRPGLYTQNAGY